MTRLLLDIDFSRRGNSQSYVLDGWSHPELTHRWTMGRESRLTLSLHGQGANPVLVLNATPARDKPRLNGQTVMLALEGRLLVTLQIDALHVAAVRLPRDLPPNAVLTITHLQAHVPRPPAQIRKGQALGLMVHTLRVFDLGSPAPVRSAEPEGLSDADLAVRFESLGQGCHFGLIQRKFGIEPLSLLRFVDTTTAMLYEALTARFASIEAPDRLEWLRAPTDPPSWRWRQKDYNLNFNTQLPIQTSDPRHLAVPQAQRLAFLRRKFLEDAAEAEKIFVLTRTDCLTEAEALAVYCALTLLGPCTLLWTTFGDPAATGQVTRVAPGFLHGELGPIDGVRYATPDAWRMALRDALRQI